MVIIESAQVIFNMKKVCSGLDFFKVRQRQRLTGERFFQVFFPHAGNRRAHVMHGGVT